MSINVDSLQSVEIKNIEKNNVIHHNKQHFNGKLTAMERINILLDPNSFVEQDSLIRHRCYDFEMQSKSYDGDGVITGIGKINGKNVAIASQDFTVIGGSLSETNGLKICKIMDIAINNKFPIIFLNDSGGARIQEGVNALAGYGEIFWRNVQASGVIPQISVIMGPCAGGAVYSPALTDFTFMVKNTSYMFVTGPEIVKSVTFEEVTKEELGGANLHTKKTGIADKAFDNDIECLHYLRDFMRVLPQSNLDTVDIDNNVNENSCGRQGYSAKAIDCSNLDYIIPRKSITVYDMYIIINSIVDRDSFTELQSEFAKNIIIGFAKFNDKSVGIVANQPKNLAGCLDVNASRKAARFIRFCDAFNIPIVSLIDVPGYLPGKKQEENAIIKHGAKLLFAYAEATVPKISVITRKAYGGSYIAMSSKHLRGDVNLCWDTAEIAVMGVEGAVNLLFRRELTKNPERKKEFVEEYTEKFVNSVNVARMGYIDNIIKPNDTRNKILHYLNVFNNKLPTFNLYKKHCNIPL